MEQLRCEATCRGSAKLNYVACGFGMVDSSTRRSRRPQRRELCCPAHPEQRIEGNGRKYFLHLLTSEQLKARGMDDKRAKLVIQAYPVLVLSN